MIKKAWLVTEKTFTLAKKMTARSPGRKKSYGKP
jgi:hypothetical protein